ncbi:metallophosphoesterase [Nesterenkonia flava]|uniref:Metallophosphoesterase n=1 Tax=Nesterenkonia flava TaxID=469799 RepID=A0ABU1FUE8_9MICC|nr:metallophosphoesterase [Nesterenkonia flava]MDR5712300.1 metallophosphoesterase [Nesterenkonia flava]
MTIRTTTINPLHAAGLAAAGSAAAGLGIGLYAGTVGLNRFTLRQLDVPVLPADHRGTLRLLHISDIHYVPGQRKKLAWLQSLAGLEPDLVINTGDNLSHRRAVPEVLEALEPLRAFPGAFVPGSNDYYAPRFKNPLRYFKGPSRLHPEAESLPTSQLFSGFESSGWINLANTHASTEVGGLRVGLSGVDDPHIDRDEFTGWPSGTTDLRIGVAHAPLQRVLQSFADAGADLVLAGHTHGGQVCLPGERALVTNCDLPTSQVKGLHYRTAVDGTPVPFHVSAGIGTSAKAPIRFNCPPEATLLTLVPR